MDYLTVDWLVVWKVDSKAVQMVGLTAASTVQNSAEMLVLQKAALKAESMVDESAVRKVG